MRFLILLLFPFLTACASISPIPQYPICDWVKEQVKTGVYDPDFAEHYYPQCAPFPDSPKPKDGKW